MKVALCGAFNTLDAGPSRVHEGLAHGLAENGVDVLMLSHGDRDTHSHPDVTVERLGDRPSSVAEHRSIYAEAKAVADERADVYHALEDQAEAADVKTVQWVTTLPQTLRYYPGELDVREELGDLVLNWLSRKGASRADVTIASSPVTQRQMKRWWRLSPDDVIPLGVGAPDRADLSTTSSPPVVLFAGRLTPKKGQREVLRHLDPDSERYDVEIVGSASSEGYADRIRERWGSSYHGFVSRDRLNELYREGDVAVVASYHENFSMAALEAAARGCVVVITDSCGFAQFEDVRQSRGTVVVPDREAAATAVREVVRADDLADRKQAAVKLADNYRWTGVAKRYLSLYRECFNGRT